MRLLVTYSRLEKLLRVCKCHVFWVVVGYGVLFLGRFFGALPPMIYFFIQHKVHRVPGGEGSWVGSTENLLLTRVPAYTHYSFFEWWLIITDVAFDSLKSRKP